MIRFNVLGPLEAWYGAEPVAVPAGRARVLLATLLLRAGRPVTAEELVDRLWDGGAPNPDRARATLQMVVRRLRQALGPANVVRTTTGGYLADLPPDALDLHRFRALAERGSFAEALRLWRGRPLSDVPSEVLHRDDVEPLLEEHLAVLERRVDVDLAAGRTDGLVPELRALTREHPLRERFRGQLMLVLAGSGRQAEALAEYAAARAVLADELGVEPGPALRALHADLLAGDGPSGRSRDHLPRDLPDFTGRAEELAEVARVADRGLVCVVDGMAGVGKTAFAVHAAHLLADRYPDGRFCIDLHGYTDGRAPREPADALAVLLYCLGVPRERVPVDLDERIALWRAETATLRAVVVLDNAFDAAQVRELLPTSTDCLVIITSRRRLVGLDGGQALSLPVLPRAVAADLFRRLADRAAIDDAALSDLVDMCDRLPLAIRLAAARLNHRTSWTAEHLADRMRDERSRLRELAVDDRDVASAFAVSYRTLDDVRRRVFRALGRHVGEDVDRYSGAALADLPVPVVDEALGALVEANLVEEPHPGRFRLHDLVRQFAQQTARSAAEAGDDAVPRLLDYYLAAVHAGDQALYPNRPRLAVRTPPATVELPAFTQVAEAVDWFESERENIAAAVRHAARAGFDEHAWQLPYLLWGFYYHGGHVADWIETHRIALDVTTRLGDDRVRARVLSGLAGGHWACGQNEEALDLYLEAHALMEAGGEFEPASVLLGNICAALDHLGRVEEGLEHAERGMRLQRELGYTRQLASTMRNAASAMNRLGRGEEAVELYAEAVEVSRRAGNLHQAATVLIEAARALSALARHDEALDAAVEGLRELECQADATATAEAACVVGNVHLRAGRLDEAMEYFHRTLGTLDQATIPWEHAAALTGIAEGLDRRGDRSAAVAHLRRAIDLYDRLGGDRADELRARLRRWDEPG
ncbi:BTAD domain-containing putative transcriptional regulator [Saccharothrix longispora]|uniref:DNA-binding SARP family transcriptional activator/tetratricopeptide (TPR) repeat protein n=1 Tax=Saccharothrix longispora TaxID=33920 RepID=A0ABU1Q1P4_9PSEU|nr:BTAD domain-containing putative transcriptional regulator [Saccharothrix longispora]MDR6596810.1 DNA-binding SARP family transcriptional activator/tetratricopeptide (TPR) repeat protein [Saccharothrix longispora]